MVFDNYSRILISSSLQKIEKRDQVVESVQTIDGVLRSLAQEADSMLGYMQGREGSRFLEETLDLLDLKNVGLYHTARRVEQKQKIISFQREHIAIEFWYKQKEKGTVEEVVEQEEYSLDGVILSSRKLQPEVEIENNFSKAVILPSRRLPPEVMAQQIKAIGSQIEHSRNVSAMRKERTMDSYFLDSVFVVYFSSYQLFGVELSFFKEKKSEKVYSVAV